MGSRIEALRAGGFNDDEIAAWSTDRRDTLRTAGFKENEIDAYFTDGVIAPDKPPQSFIDRIDLGNALTKVISAKSRVLGHTAETAIKGFGDPTPTGFDDKTLNQLIDLGIFHDPTKGRPGPIQFVNEMVGLPAAKLIDTTLRSISAGVHGAGGFIGALYGELGEPLGGTAKQAEREVVNFGNWAMVEAGFGRFSRPQAGRPGEAATDQIIGGLPKSEEFMNAAKVTGDGTAPRATQQKLLDIYEQQGRHPAEVAVDAQTDPIVQQRLLSKDPLDVPYGAKPAEPDAVLRPGYAPERPAGMTPAIKLGDEVYTGKSHVEAWEKAQAELGDSLRSEIQKGADYGGFIDPAKPSEYLSFTEALKRSEAGEPPKPPEAPKPPPPEPPPEPGSLAEAHKKIHEKISIGERETRPWTLDRLYTEAIDDLHPIKAVSEDAYQMARLTRGTFGMAEQYLERATFDFATRKNTGKPLQEIVEPVRDDLNGLRDYLASRRTIELEAQGRRSGFDLASAEKIVAEETKKYGKVADELVAYQNRLLEYLKDSGVLTEDAFVAMLEANQNYVPFYRLMIGKEGGPPAGGKTFGPGNPIKRLKGSERDIIDPLESIIKNTYAYISIAERNAVGITLIDALKREGFEVQTKRSIRADPELVNYLREHGVKDPNKLAEFVMHAGPEEGTTLRAFRDGVREEVVVNDPELVAAFRGIDRASAGLITRIVALPARTLRAGAVLTPEFMARNMMRDFLTAFINTGKGIFSPVDTLKGLKSVITKDEAYQNWVKSGGANATMVSLDRLYLQESLTKLAGETGLMDRAWNVVKDPLRPLRMLSETIENATRVGEFRKVMGQETSKEAMQAAAYSAREVTLDFARMGAKMRSYNMITAFANAQIQGVDRMIRAFKDKPTETSLKIAGSVTVPSVLLWWANHDDERYKELPNWQKDLFWIIPTDKWEPIDAADAGLKPKHLIREKNGKYEFNNGSIYRIPKPFEIGVIFGSGPERLLDATIGKNPEAFKGFTKSVLEVLTPNLMPTAVVPAIEQYANRSTFTDRTLIPAAVEKHLPEYQYTPYTTQLTRKLAQVISAFPGMREAAVEPGAVGGGPARALTTPILIENYIRAWSGGLGMYALEATDTGLRKAGVLPDPIKPAATLADIPFIKAFTVRYPSATAQSIQDFYDEHNKMKRFYDTWKARAKEGDKEAQARIKEAGGPELQEKTLARMENTRKTLSEHSKWIRDIYKNPQIPADEKRQLIDGVYYRMIEIAKYGRTLQRATKQPVE